MSEKYINMKRRIKAALSIELSLTMTMVTVGVILILALFGRSLATAFLETTFPKHFAQKQDVSKTLVNNNKNTAFTPTQIDVAVTASQGIKFNTKEEAESWSLSAISDVLDMDAPAQFDLESLAKAATIADKLQVSKFSTDAKTLSKAEFKNIISTDKYGSIKIKSDSEKQELTTTVNGKKIAIKFVGDYKNDVIAQVNAIYNATFE